MIPFAQQEVCVYLLMNLLSEFYRWDVPTDSVDFTMMDLVSHEFINHEPTSSRQHHLLDRDSSCLLR